jgi:signal transduction histidine kinase
MIGAAKAWGKRHWPALRLRTILFGVLFLTAALPGISAIGLRVYENTLVRQTEAELIAQGAALSATASALWPGAQPLSAKSIDRRARGYYRPENTTVDLRASPILPERPEPRLATHAPDPDALKAAAILDPIIEQTSRTTLASILLLDRTGLIARGPGAGGDLSDLPEVRQALAGKSQTTLRRNGDYRSRYALEWLSRASDLRLHHARPVVVNGRVVGVVLLSRSPRALFRGLYEDRVKIVLGIAVIFGLLIVLSGLVSRGVTRPIEGLSAASREVADGRGSIPETPATAAVEIRALYEDFRAMAAAIDRRSRYLRDFAAAVSHEFKTPLAGIQGAVELLQDHGESMSREERRRFLYNISAGSQRLAHLVSRLLDLARADMARAQPDASVDIGRVAHRIADAHSTAAAKIVVDLPIGLGRAAVSEAALESVLTTVIDNSLKAGADLVTITARTGQEAVTLTVADNGFGVPPGDRTRLFEPFFTSRRIEGGTGLGLSIARSLLAASHGRIELGEAAEGASFDIVLPPSPS